MHNGDLLRGIVTRAYRRLHWQRNLNHATASMCKAPLPGLFQAFPSGGSVTILTSTSKRIPLGSLLIASHDFAWRNSHGESQ